MFLMDEYRDNIRQCAACRKKDENDSFRKCSGCGNTYYCSRGCQRGDWKRGHKGLCGTGITAQQAMGEELDRMLSIITTGGVEDPLPNRIRNGAWLSTFPEDEAFKRIIDSYRLRIVDEYNLNGKQFDQEDPAADFKEYLDTAERKGEILPGWWTAEKKEACMSLGQQEGEHNLRGAVTKASINDGYGEATMAMKLRMVAQMITGRQVGGASSGTKGIGPRPAGSFTSTTTVDMTGARQPETRHF